MDNLNTDNLIQEIRSGNKDAVKSVYQAYAKDVYNFSKSITGDHDSALAATKKTFLTLFKDIQNGNEPSNIRTEALRIAYNEIKPPVADAGTKAEEPMAPIRDEATADRRKPAPVIDDYDEEEEYDQGYEEEEDDFEPPVRDEEDEPESVYIPKGGYDTLKIDPVDVDEEQTEMRSRRRRPRPAMDEFDEEYDERPRSRRHQDDYDDDRDDDYYDDYDEYEERKPRRKGLFIFCIILNVVLILILLWFLGGLLINLGVLPDIDLGYSWFNGHIYPLF